MHNKIKIKVKSNKRRDRFQNLEMLRFVSQLVKSGKKKKKIFPKFWNTLTLIHFNTVLWVSDRYREIKYPNTKHNLLTRKFSLKVWNNSFLYQRGYFFILIHKRIWEKKNVLLSVCKVLHTCVKQNSKKKKKKRKRKRKEKFSCCYGEKKKLYFKYFFLFYKFKFLLKSFALKGE